MNKEVINSYIIPIITAILIIAGGVVMSELLTSIDYKNFILACILFMIIGFAIYLAEVYRSSHQRNEILSEIRKLSRQDSKSYNHPNREVKSLDFNDVTELERQAKEVWIYAFDLAWEMEDNELTGIVYDNLKKGTKYKYIIPNSEDAISRAKILKTRYEKLKSSKKFIEFRVREQEIDLLRLGVVIFNPSILGRNTSETCSVVFFPHFSDFSDENANIFLCLNGNATRIFQEDYIRIWNDKAIHVGDSN